MMQELMILIKMLFYSKPDECNGLSIIKMKHFPFRGYAYLMWCGRLIYREDNELYHKRQHNSEEFKMIVNHEEIHLAQAKVAGSWVRYYWCYLIEWMKGGNIASAYYTNPYECEAYANEGDMGYTKKYDGSNLQRYRFKHRHRLYKNAGGTPGDWIQYIKQV